MELSNEAFQQFNVSDALPAQMLSGYEALDRRCAELARAEVEHVAKERENRRLAQLEAERTRQEQSRIAAEAAASKAEAERQRKAEAEAARNAEHEAKQKKVKQNLDQFMERIKAAQASAGGKIVHRVSIEGDKATITVDNSWHLMPYQIRLQAAQSLWKSWASIASPDDLDKARIRLVDFNGNEVGGSRILGGSLIWVQEK
jgi:hypothetical protein